MNNTKPLFLPVILLAFCLVSCKDKRHDLSKKYKLEHYAFTLVVSEINSREFYLKMMRENIQQKKKTVLDPNRTDTLKGDRRHLASYDTLFFQSDKLLHEPEENNDSGRRVDSKPPDNLTREEVAWLKEQTGSLATLFRQISGTYRRFDQYYTAAGYKADKGAQGQELIDSIRILDDKFGVISDSILLRSDRIFKDIYKVPEEKNPLPAAALMKQSIEACNNYRLVLEQLLPGKQGYNATIGKELKHAKDAIDDQINQLVHIALSGTERSIWADVLVLNFREQLFSFRNYYEVRLNPESPKGGVQQTDLDFLNDVENRMRRYYSIYLKL